MAAVIVLDDGTTIVPYNSSRTGPQMDRAMDRGDSVGVLTDLTTTEKSSVVGAINEVNGEVTNLNEDLSQLWKYNESYLSQDNIELFNPTDSDVVIGYGFSGTTDTMVAQNNLSITGYIPIYTGVLFTATMDNKTIFDNNYGFVTGVKVAIYDSNKTWKKTVDLTLTPYSTPNVDFEQSGYIRIAYYNNTKLSVISDADKYIDGNMVKIHDGSITKDKLDTEFVEEYEEIKTKVLGTKAESYFENVSFENGQYIGSNTPFGSPNQSANTASTTVMLKLSELGSDIQILSNLYKFAICTFNADGSFKSGTASWIDTSKTVLTKDDIINNPVNHNFEYFIIQVRRIDSANFDFSTVDISTILKADKLVVSELKECDLFMFMGQSNMAGRGITSSVWTETSPTIINDAGYEFRAITDKTKLYPISEPFGLSENKSSGINDGTSKTGSMVTAFVNEYYKHTGVSIVGVSASQGGTNSVQWLPTGTLLPDAIQRLTDAVQYLESNNITIRHKFMLWCQGESDGDSNRTETAYTENFNSILSAMVAAGIEKCFIVRIGNRNVDEIDTKYKTIIETQNHIAQTNPNVIMVSTDLAGMKERGLMKDQFHYYQAGYNEVGRYAGINTAIYVNTGKEPTMYDTDNNSLYYSHKN